MVAETSFEEVSQEEGWPAVILPLRFAAEQLATSRCLQWGYCRGGRPVLFHFRVGLAPDGALMVRAVQSAVRIAEKRPLAGAAIVQRSGR
jgi:hypothetical protein